MAEDWFNKISWFDIIRQNRADRELSRNIPPTQQIQQMIQAFYGPYYPNGYKGRGFQGEEIDIKPKDSK